MAKLSIKDITLSGKRAIVRLDLNVPLDDHQAVTDTVRIDAAVPTLQLLLAQCERVVVMSHLGRPKGRRVAEMSLAPVSTVLAGLLNCTVRLAPDCTGLEVQKLLGATKPGELLLLENLRFHAEEEANEPGFARELAGLGDLYVNDAFGTAHRAHASTEGITHYLSEAVSGLLMEREIRYLHGALRDPERPFSAILGGAKVSDKIELIDHLLDKVDCLLIGGAMAFTFLKAQGLAVGRSLVEAAHLETATHALKRAREKGVRLLLPVDAVAVEEIRDDAAARTIPVDSFPEEMRGVDLGPNTCRAFAGEIEKSRTIIWNGPMGIFEMEPFAAGSREIAMAVASATAAGGVSIIGGGDTAAAVKQADLVDNMSHISTGGGASLECLSGRTLPGVAALTEKPE